MSLSRRVLLGFIAVAVSACATQSQRLSQKGFEAIELLRALPATARPRIVIAPVQDQTDGAASQEFQAALETAASDAMTVQGWLGGVRELLQTGLLNTGAFTVLEREDLDELADERLWTANNGQAALPAGRLEGADILVAPALTAFEPSGGGALPLPVPLSRNGDFGIIWLRAGSASISMDIRLIDVASGRVLKTTAVRGKARKFRADLDLFFIFDNGYAALPGVLAYYNNTPLHAAMLKMVTLAVDEIGRAARPNPKNIADPATAALFAPAADERMSPETAGEGAEMVPAP